MSSACGPRGAASSAGSPGRGGRWSEALACPRGSCNRTHDSQLDQHSKPKEQLQAWMRRRSLNPKQHRQLQGTLSLPRLVLLLFLCRFNLVKLIVGCWSSYWSCFCCQICVACVVGDGCWHCCCCGWRRLLRVFTVVLIMKVFMVFLVVCVGRVTCVDVIVLSLFSVILAIAVVAHVGDCALALVFVACAVITPCVFVVCCNRMWLRPIAPACGFQPPPQQKTQKQKCKRCERGAIIQGAGRLLPPSAV